MVLVMVLVLGLGLGLVVVQSQVQSQVLGLRLRRVRFSRLPGLFIESQLRELGVLFNNGLGFNNGEAAVGLNAIL